MLQAHLNAIEQHLLTISKIPANSGHSLHKGTPREAFVKEFLASHLSSDVAVGTGEIISAESKPSDARNQIDIIIYKKNYPKIDFGGGINAFLAESVVATIEVKSVLDRDGLEKAIKAAHTVKNLNRSVHTVFTSGYKPPSILSYVVAYDGPTHMKTVLDWIPLIHASLQINPKPKTWPITNRYDIPSPSIDGVFVLGRGLLFFDNSPLSLATDDPGIAEVLIKWGAADTSQNNLFFLFMLLTVSLGGISGSWLNPEPYLANRIIHDAGKIDFLCVNDAQI